MDRRSSIIGRQVFRIQVNSPENADFVIQEVRHFVTTRMEAILEKFAAGIIKDRPDRSTRVIEVLLLDSITLDIGKLDKDDFQEQLAANLERQLMAYKDQKLKRGLRQQNFFIGYKSGEGVLHGKFKTCFQVLSGLFLKVYGREFSMFLNTV